MSKNHRGLGKGLGAIFQDKKVAHRNDPTIENAGPVVVPDGARIEDIAVERVSPNPFQPRKNFDQTEIEELASSIRDKGLIQPIVLRKHGEGFQIIAGERRFRACLHLGRTHVQGIVHDQYTDREMREVAIIENIQRVQLNPIEEAEAYHELLTDCGLTHDQLAERLGKSRSAITNTLRLLKLHGEVRELLLKGDLTAGHARALAPLPEERQVELARQAVTEHWSVRAMEAQAHGPLVKEEPKVSPPKAPERTPLHPDVVAFVRRIEECLGTRVQIDQAPDGGKGNLKILFVSNDDLNRIGHLILAGSPSA